MRITDDIKVDVALVGQTISNTNVTGRYFSMTGASRACFVLIGGALATTKVSTLALLQATDEAGSGAKGIPSDASPTATCTTTSPAKCTEATLVLLSVANADAITINGLVYTANTDTTTKATRQYKIDGNDAADAVALAGLINDTVYGVPGVVASVSTATITLRSADGSKAITLASVPTTITAAVTKHQQYVNIDAADLDTANGFKYVAAKVTTDGVGIFTVVLLRSGMRHSPKQVVGASASI